HYGSIRVSSGATAYLKSGEYRMESLQVEGTGSVKVASESGPVRIYVADDVALKGSVQPFSDEVPNLVLVYFGDSAVSVSGSFNGTLLAPNSTIDVQGGLHTATFYGASVSLADSTQVEASPGSTISELIPDLDAPADETIDRSGSTGGLAASTD